MKKVKKIITGFLMVFIFMAMVLPMTTVKASEEKEAVEKRMYTVTFRAGNVASFDTDKITVSDGMEVTKNYIKVKVAKGDTLAFTVPGWESDAGLTSWFSNCLHYEKEAAYGLKDFNGVVGTAVERNTEYVLDYKRLIDPVSYTVSFIDSQTKEQIATPQIIYGNAEETIMVTPVTVSDYTPTESSKIIKLEKGKENTATFEYRYTGAVETITSTVTNVVPGTTRTETVVNEVEETVIVPGTSQPTGFTANVVNNASNAVNAPVGNTANNAADNAVNAPADDNEDQTVDDSNVEIPEEQTKQECISLHECLTKRLQTGVSAIHRCSAIDIDFINNEGIEDETQIYVYHNILTRAGTKEAEELFRSLEKELGANRNRIISCTVVASAETVEELDKLLD